VLELKSPGSPTFEALGSLWPTAVWYAVSYVFIAIVWINRHHLLRYADIATGRLVWGGSITHPWLLHQSWSSK